MTAGTRRVDAYEKVTGKACYAADRVPVDVAYAMFAVARIGKGRITRIDTSAAEEVPGVRLAVTRFGPGELIEGTFVMGGGHGFQSLQPLLGDQVAYRGQPIALIVADTPVAATEAADLVVAEYEPEPFAGGLDADGATSVIQEKSITLPFLSIVKECVAANVVVEQTDLGYATVTHDPMQYRCIY